MGMSFLSRFSRTSLVAALAAAVLVASAPAEALTVTPIQVEMTTVGNTGRGQVTVTNDSKEPVPIEIVMQKMTIDENGDRKFAKADDNFLIMPPQAVIAGGASQVFRIQWVGDPQIAESQSYMMNVNQVPVRMPKGQSAVQIVMSFGVNINVAPPQGMPELKVVGTGVATDKSGKRQPTITVENASRIHALLPHATIKLAAGGWSRTFSPSEISEKVGIGLVQPGRRRKFVLPVEVPANVQTVQASLDFKPKR